MVEARGFEPLSEDNATQASTGVVTVLMSPFKLHLHSHEESPSVKTDVQTSPFLTE